MKNPLVALAFVGLLIVGAPAQASTQYFASVDEGGFFNFPHDFHSGTSPVSAAAGLPSGLLTGRSRASNTLGTFASVSTLGLQPGLGYIRSEAAFVASDAFIAGSGSSITVPMQIFLDGALQVALAANPGGTDVGRYNGGSRLIVDIWIDPASGPAYRAGHGQREVGVGQVGAAPAEDARTSEGFLGAAAWTSSFGRDTISGLVATDALQLPVNESFAFQINLTSIAFAAVAPPFNPQTITMTAVATSDFLSTLGFGLGAPILLLPQGFDFDVPSLGIVDNLCTGSSCVTTPVPEPPAALLLLLGAALTFATTRRRRA